MTYRLPNETCFKSYMPKWFSSKLKLGLKKPVRPIMSSATSPKLPESFCLPTTIAFAYEQESNLGQMNISSTKQEVLSI